MPKGFSYKLEKFEGPLDLLLHLIEKDKINIYDIPVAQIAEQYMEYVSAMQEKDLDIMSDFLVMAATLLDIKSRMLLPVQKDDENGIEEDPRKELVEKLLEYKRFKLMAQELAGMEFETNHILFKECLLPEEVAGYEKPVVLDELLEGVELHRLKSIFEEIIKRSEYRLDRHRSSFGTIKKESISLEERINSLMQYASAKRKFSFRGIPYRVLGGMRFYDRKEIKDVMSYMHLVENPSDDVAMARIINEPKRGLGPKSLGGIVSYAKAYKLSIFEALKEQDVLGSLSRKSRAAVEDLVTMLDELGAEQDNMELSDIYDNLIRRSGYLTALEAENTVEADARIENILELRSVIAEFEEKAAGSVLTDEEDEFREERDRLREDGFDVKEPTLLQSFLERIALLSDIDNRDESEDAVVMMTLHSSKGLEFPVVFMPGMENGLFPGSASMDDPSKMEEERRLCYVGITRAMRKLYLTGAQTRMLYGRTDFTIESEFMREMDTDLLEGDPTVAERTASAGGIRGDGGILGMREFKGRYDGSADGYDASFGKPFDALKFAKKQASKGISNEGFEAGDRIRHPKFGEGLLIDQDAKTLTIAFDSVGIKKLGKGFVKLTKVE